MTYHKKIKKKSLSQLSYWQIYWLLTRQHRPIGWLLLLWPTWWALWLAANGLPDIKILLIFTFGGVVMRSAGCVINDYADQWLDAHVHRTKDRPLAANLISRQAALGLFLVLICIAFVLVLMTNDKTVMLSCIAVSLTVVYPFLKRYTYWPQVWLGATFGMAIPMAYTAVTGAWPTPLAWLLFCANILWTTAYDTWYAMADRDEDLQLGAKSTAILFGELDLIAIALLQGCFLITLVFVGVHAKLGLFYNLSLVLVVVQFVWQLKYARNRQRERCFQVFVANQWVGMTVFIGIAVDMMVR